MNKAMASRIAQKTSWFTPTLSASFAITWYPPYPVCTRTRARCAFLLVSDDAMRALLPMCNQPADCKLPVQWLCRPHSTTHSAIRQFYESAKSGDRPNQHESLQAFSKPSSFPVQPWNCCSARTLPPSSLHLILPTFRASSALLADESSEVEPLCDQCTL